MRRYACSLAVLVGVAGCQERTPTCEEAVRHTAAIMKRSSTESKRSTWSDDKFVDGQIRFCKRETPNEELRKCVVDASSEAGIEHCIETFVDR